MLINYLNITTEFFLWLLIYGVTFSNAVVEVSTGFLIFIFLARRFVLRDARPPRSGINLALYAFCAVLFVSLLRSAYFEQSINGFFRAVKYVFLYFAIVDFLQGNAKRLERLFWAVIAVAGFTFLNGIFQGIFGFDILRHRQIDRLDFLHRIGASFVTPNDFGAYILSVLPLGFCFFSPGISKRKKVILVTVLILGFYCLIRTSSRGAWIGFFISVLIFFFMYKKKLLAFIPIAVILFIMVSPHGFGRLANVFSAGKSTVWERTQLWKGTWDMIQEHPVLGFGINTFSKYFPQYKPADYPDLRYTHNSYLQMWSEIGIVGLFVFLGIVFIILKEVFHKIKKKVKSGFNGLVLLGLACGYIGFLIHSGVDTNLHSLVLITQFWIVSAYLACLNKSLEAKTDA